MRHMTATSLHHLAGPRPTGLRILFASMARVANAALDRAARASYLSGLLGYRPGVVRTGDMDEALEAVRTGTGGNKIADILLYEKDMSEQEAMRLLGTRDTKLKEAIARGARKILPRDRESLRGLTLDIIVDDIADGFSPLTGERFPSYGGGDMYYHTGRSAKDKPKISMGGIAVALEKQGENKAYDILRGTREEELGAMYLDAPVGEGEAGSTLHDALGGESAISRADYIRLYASIFKNPTIMGAIDKMVMKELEGKPAQQRVWEVIRRNPDIIIVNKDGSIGASSSQLERAHELLFGEEETPSPSKLRRHWVDGVLPSMQKAFKDSNIARDLLRKREIREIIEEETRRRRPHRNKIRNIRKVDDRMPGLKWAAKRVASRYMAKKAGHYGIKARWRFSDEGWANSWVATYKGHQLEVARNPYGGDMLIFIDGKERGQMSGRGQRAVDFAKAQAEEFVDRGRA